LGGQSNLIFQIKELKPFPKDVHGIAINPVDKALYFTSFDSGNLYKLDYPYENAYVNTGVTGKRNAGLLWHKQSFLVTSYSIPGPWNMTTDGNAIYAVTFNGELYKIENQQLQLLASGLGYPFDIAYSPAQTLYISEQSGSNVPGRIAEYDLNGNLLHVLPNIFTTPQGIAFNDTGDLVVADNGTGCISCIHPDGSTSIISCDFNQPIAVTPNLSNQMLVSIGSASGTLLEVSSNLSTNLDDSGIENMLLFPNPATNKLFVSMDVEVPVNPEVLIYSYAGQQIHIKEITQSQSNNKLEISVNTSEMSPGNYILKLRDESFQLSRQFTISR